MDRVAEAYKHAWGYIEYLRDLESKSKEAPQDSVKEVEDRFQKYSERFASMLEREGVLQVMAFIASKSGQMLKKLADTFPRAEKLGQVRGYEEELAHSLIFDCYSRWLVKLGLMKEEDYRSNPLSIMNALSERVDDVGFKLNVLTELSTVAIALKNLAAGAFKE